MTQRKKPLSTATAARIALVFRHLLNGFDVVLLFREEGEKEVFCLTNTDTKSSLEITKEYIGYENNLEESYISKPN